MKPSRFIMNSNYATSQNDATGSFTVTIPSSWVIPRAGIRAIDSYYSIGQKSSGMRTVISSSKYPGVNLVSTSIIVPCTGTYYSNSQQATITINSFIYVYTYRWSPDRLILRAIAKTPDRTEWRTGDYTITNAAQTITCHVSTFLSPFES